MTNRSGPCNDEDLSVLLDGDGDSDQFRCAASHVDSCAECQRRLADLSADADHWIVQREMLRPIEGDLLENGVERAYLTDFGLARASDDASLTYTGVIAGTPHYMSPEQADGQPLDHRSDLFSLGSVLYFMATGHPPFRADRPMAVLKRTCHDPHRPAWECNAEIPDPLSAIIDRLLEKNPRLRFASAGELQRDLAKVLSDVQQGKLSRLRRRTMFRPMFWPFAAGLLALVAFAGLIIGWLPTKRRNRQSRERTQPTAQEIPLDSGIASSQSPLAQLSSVDPSPSSQAQAELDTLARMLDSLETTPFPESEFKELNHEFE
jgi:serine/threonine protein kinase